MAHLDLTPLRSGANIRVTLDAGKQDERWIEFDNPRLRVVNSSGDYFSASDERFAREAARLER